MLFIHRMAETNGKSNKQSGRGGRNVLLFAFIVISASVAVWLWATRSSDSASASAGAVRSTLHLETFVLNVASPDQRAYLRVGMDLGLNQEPKRGEPIPIAQIRDTILGVLAESKADDLATPAGKTSLKHGLLRALRERVPQIGVEEIYFTEFLIQR